MTFTHTDTRAYEGRDDTYDLAISIELVAGYYEVTLTMDTYTWSVSFLRLTGKPRNITPGTIIARSHEEAISLAWLYCEGKPRRMEWRDAQAKYRYWKKGAQSILDTLATKEQPLIAEYMTAQEHAQKAIRTLNPDFILRELIAAQNALYAGNAVMAKRFTGTFDTAQENAA